MEDDTREHKYSPRLASRSVDPVGPRFGLSVPFDTKCLRSSVRSGLGYFRSQVLPEFWSSFGHRSYGFWCIRTQVPPVFGHGHNSGERGLQKQCFVQPRLPILWKIPNG